NGDKRASLLVTTGRDGVPCVVGYAPGCAYTTQKGKRYDAASVVCHQEGISCKELLQRISKKQTAARRNEPPITKPVPAPTPGQLAARAQDAERKREARRVEAAITLADVESRARQDADLSERDHLVLLALLEVADDRDWCRPSNGRLAEMIGV